MKQRTCSVDGLLMNVKQEISIRCNAFLTLQELTSIFQPLKDFIGLIQKKKKQEGKGARERREKKRRAWREEDSQEEGKDKVQPKLHEENLFTEEQIYSRRISDIGTFDNLNRMERKEKRGEERWREEKERSFTKTIVTMEKSFYPTYCGLCRTL